MGNCNNGYIPAFSNGKKSVLFKIHLKSKHQMQKQKEFFNKKSCYSPGVFVLYAEVQTTFDSCLTAILRKEPPSITSGLQSLEMASSEVIHLCRLCNGHHSE